jgi:hypothetical protein
VVDRYLPGGRAPLRPPRAGGDAHSSVWVLPDRMTRHGRTATTRQRLDMNSTRSPMLGIRVGLEPFLPPPLPPASRRPPEYYPPSLEERGGVDHHSFRVGSQETMMLDPGDQPAIVWQVNRSRPGVRRLCVPGQHGERS